MDLSGRTNYENKLVLYQGHMNGDQLVWVDFKHELWRQSSLRESEVCELCGKGRKDDHAVRHQGKDAAVCENCVLRPTAPSTHHDAL